MKNEHRSVICALITALLILLVAAGCSQEPVTRTELRLDTAVSVTVYGGDESLIDGAMEIIGRCERLWSRTIAESDVSRINAANGEAVTVSSETIKLLQFSIEQARVSGGAFDPCVGAESSLWDFSSQDPRLPDADALDKAVKTATYENIALDGDSVTMKNGAKLDLGGVAKGYIADRVGEYLRGAGISGAMVNLGGNTVTVGNIPGRDEWRIGVASPFSGEGALYGVLCGDIGSAVTSGDYQRCFTLDGVSYHHILDRTTGYPARSGVASVTVVSENSAQADAMSTALFVLGVEKGLKLAESLEGLEAVFIAEDGTLSYTSGISERREPGKLYFERASPD